MASDDRRGEARIVARWMRELASSFRGGVPLEPFLGSLGVRVLPGHCAWLVRFMGQTCSATLSRCALAPTDSWEKLADDLARYDEHKVTCEYFGMTVDGTCDGCRAHSFRAHHPGRSCIAFALDDVASRVRALKEAGEGRDD